MLPGLLFVLSFRFHPATLDALAYYLEVAELEAVAKA
jgi:hypothetical protein